MKIVSTPELSVHVLSVEEWFEVADCPRPGRSTQRLARALNGYLKTFSPLHASVAMAQLPDGQRFKLDGHSRAVGWQINSISRPTRLYATVVEAEDLPTVIRLREAFDSALAVRSCDDWADIASAE
ncbi:MAG TPA: hypothetical protein VM639_23730 [Dongiaceae bacterium]|nr:hypothetical protein [Dongiaceae bacterium]